MKTQCRPTTLPVLLFVIGLAACGGGGSGGGSGILPTPNPPPPVLQGCTGGPAMAGSQVVNPAGAPQSVNVTSNPSSLNVQLDGNSLGLTPQTLTPAFSSIAHSITVQNNAGGSDYSVCFAQNGQSGAQVFYNQAMDTAGNVVNIASFMRRPRSANIVAANLPANLTRRIWQSNPSGPATLPGALEVVYSNQSFGTDRAQMAAVEARAGAVATRTFAYPALGKTIRILRINPGSAASVSASLRARPGILDVAPVQVRFLKAAIFPTNSGFQNYEQWDMGQGLPQGFPSTDLPDAWGELQSQSPTLTFGSPNVTIAIIDTGVDTAPANTLVQSQLIPRITYAEEDVTTSGSPPAPAIPCGALGTNITGCSAVADADGHGTNVAGIAGSFDSQTPGYPGVAGLAGNASLQIYKIFGSGGTANTADEAQAIGDAVNKGASIINLSLGSCPNAGSGPDPVEEAAIESAINAGVFVVAAAGNERSSTQVSCPQVLGQLDYPAAYPGVMAVGATAVKDPTPGIPSGQLEYGSYVGATEYVAGYSNSGPGLGVVAPGGDPNSPSDPDLLHWITNLYSTTGSPPCSSATNCLVLIAGTSMATPHVAGAAALMQAAYEAANGGAKMTPAMLLQTLDASADTINDPNQGHGRLDVCRAVALAQGIPSTTCAATPAGVYKPAATQLIAFAYTNSGASMPVAPRIVDLTFPLGLTVNANGTFRIADVPTSAATFKIGVWYDADGDGKIDAGDYFGSAGPCTPNAPCSGAGSITVTQITSNSSLP